MSSLWVFVLLIATLCMCMLFLRHPSAGRVTRWSYPVESTHTCIVFCDAVIYHPADHQNALNLISIFDVIQYALTETVHWLAIPGNQQSEAIYAPQLQPISISEVYWAPDGHQHLVLASTVCQRWWEGIDCSQFNWKLGIWCWSTGDVQWENITLTEFVYLSCSGFGGLV